MFSSKKVPVSKEHMEYLKNKVSQNIYTVYTNCFGGADFCFMGSGCKLKNYRCIYNKPAFKNYKDLLNLYNEGELFKHIAVTCAETVIGFY